MSSSGRAYAPLVDAVHVVAAAGAAQNIPDPKVTAVSRYTLTANCVFTLPSPVAGTAFTVQAVQDATGGRTATFTGAKWPGGAAPVLSTSAGAVDVLTFICIDGASWEGFVAGKGVT